MQKSAASIRVRPTHAGSRVSKRLSISVTPSSSMRCPAYSEILLMICSAQTSTNQENLALMMALISPADYTPSRTADHNFVPSAL